MVDCNDDPEEEGRSLLSFKINDGDEVFLCSLRLKNKEMCVLDLELDGLANVVFSVKGRREIHLVGSYRDLLSDFVNQRYHCPLLLLFLFQCIISEIDEVDSNY